AITNLQRKFDKLLFFYLFIWVGNFSYLSVAIRKQAKIVTRRCIGTNKIRKTHTFWRNFFNHGEI
ncbi:hypothetical protein, partial [Bacteroides thetaiotaomicron]|uniref:hypothetical protein n=1 Tax=Bacteroides thetaiotaomicron TaxID=818 RepID=UPI00232F87B9